MGVVQREYTSPLFNTDNQYLKYYIYVWEESTNVINNTSNMSVSVIAIRTNTGYTTNYGGGCAIKLDGVEQPSQYWNWGEKPVYYESYTTLYQTSSWDQAHDANGTKTMNIAASCWWYSNGSVYIDSSWQSFNVTLTAIDRAAPTVTISTSNVGVNSFSLSASSNVTCDRWDRSIDNGSTWTNFSTTSGTSASTTISGLSPNTTYNVKVRARKSSNQVYGTSGTSSVKTIGNSVLNSVSTVTADNAIVSFTINVTVYVASYTHKLEIKNGNTTILTKTGLTLASGNNTITLTSSERTTLLNAMANIKNFTGTFNLSTWSGSTQIGSASSKTATVQTTAANSAPTFTGFTYVDGNSTSTAVTENNQILIGGFSTITVTATAATAKNSATIKSYSLVFGNTTASSTTTTITTGTITNTGTVALTVSAVDSRGYSTSQTVNVTSLPYSKIVFKTSSLRRVNEVENTIQLAFTGEMKDITINNVDKNSVQVCQYRYKKTSDNDYGGWTSIVSGVTRSGNNLSYTNNSLTTLDANYSWNVQVNIQDKLTSDTITLTVGQGTPLMSWRTKKVGINQKDPTEALDVVGNIKVAGDFISNGKDVVLGTTGSNSNDTGDIWFRYGNGREKMRIWGADTYTSATGPNFRIFKTDGTQVYSGTLVIRSQAPYMYTDSYPTLLEPGGTNSWIKFGTSNTSYGILPSASGAKGSGHNYIGTSSWYWKYAYIDEGNFQKINGVTLPATPVFTDNNNAVTQTATDTTNNDNYEMLFSGTNDNTTRTEGARKTNRIKVNPANGKIQGYNSSGGMNWSLRGNNGEIVCVTLIQSSSKKIKKNIKSIEDSEKILQLQAVSFDFKDKSRGVNKRGFIAEDVNKILPNVTTPETEDAPMGINYTELIPYLQDIVKKQEARIEALEAQVKALQKGDN